MAKERIRLTEESKVQLKKIEKDFELDDSEGSAYVYSFFKVMSKLFRTS